MLTLGAVGLFLALPGGRLSLGRLALVVLVGAGGMLLTLLLPLAQASGQWGWFTAFTLIGLFAAVRVITHRRPVYSALYFIIVIVAIAGLLVLMQAEFLSVALLIIYAGAILVTYVFVIMLAQQSHGQPRYDAEAREPFWGVLTGFVLMAVIAAHLFAEKPRVIGGELAADAPGAGTVAHLGTHLLTQYVIGVEVAGVLLLAAMVGAIAVARRKAEAE